MEVVNLVNYYNLHGAGFSDMEFCKYAVNYLRVDDSTSFHNNTHGNTVLDLRDITAYSNRLGIWSKLQSSSSQD